MKKRIRSRRKVSGRREQRERLSSSKRSPLRGRRTRSGQRSRTYAALRRRRAKRRMKQAPVIRPVNAERLTVAAVVAAVSDQHTFAAVLRELAALRLDELVIVLDGDANGHLAQAMAVPDATVVYTGQPRGGDACRAAGAGMTDADIVLFLDGSQPIAASRLAPYVEAIRRGADIVLPDNAQQLGPFSSWDDAARLQAFLNRSLNRSGLGACSLAELPHAMSRRAIAAVGHRTLAEPAKAHALALTQGLRIEAVPGVEARRASSGADRGQPIRQHLEALRMVMAAGGPRLSLTDRVRRRQAAGEANR